MAPADHNSEKDCACRMKAVNNRIRASYLFLSVLLHSSRPRRNIDLSTRCKYLQFSFAEHSNFEMEGYYYEKTHERYGVIATMYLVRDTGFA